jgi:hypothetical protein
MFCGGMNMQIKIFNALTESRLETKVNNFTARKDIKVIELQFSATVFYFAVMIVYENIASE